MNELNHLKKGMIKVFISNILYLLISIISNFLLPRMLSVDSYAEIKTYQLYISYAGVLSLGFVDGMFLNYGGANLKTIDKKKLEINISTFRIFQVLMMLFFLILSFIMHNTILIFFSIAFFPLNMMGYFKSLYQAIGEFSKYSKIMNITTISTFFANILLLFIIKIDNYFWYILLYVVFDILIWLFFEYNFHKKLKIKIQILKYSMIELKNNIKEGILLMFGNFSNIILTSMDRWFIKELMNTMAFAEYSFACSMENFVNVAISPISITMYNFFCKEKNPQKIIQIRNAVMIFGAILLCFSFVVKFIIEIYLPNYKNANNVIILLFASQFFHIINKSIYINLYKSEHRQNKYFIRLIFVIIIGFLLNVITYHFFEFKESFAVATLISSILWLIFSSFDFRKIHFSMMELIYIILVITVFIISGIVFNSFIGLTVYSVFIFFASCILLKKDVKFLINIIFSLIKKKVK